MQPERSLSGDLTAHPSPKQPTHGVAARIFAALAHAHINVRMIDQGSSELNVIVAVKETAFEQAIRCIYEMFVNSVA